MPGDIAHWHAEFSLGMEILRHVYMLSSSSELRIPMWIKVQSFLDWVGCDFANLNIVSHLDICFQVNIIQRESYWKRGNYFPVRWNSAAQSRWRLRTSPFLLSLLCDLGQFLWPHWTSGEKWITADAPGDLFNPPRVSDGTNSLLLQKVVSKSQKTHTTIWGDHCLLNRCQTLQVLVLSVS